MKVIQKNKEQAANNFKMNSSLSYCPDKPFKIHSRTNKSFLSSTAIKEHISLIKKFQTVSRPNGIHKKLEFLKKSKKVLPPIKIKITEKKAPSCEKICGWETIY